MNDENSQAKGMRDMIFRTALFSLAVGLLLVDCPSLLGQNQSTPETDIVTGRLSIDGKPVHLQHIYARRMKRSTRAGNREVLALVLTTKALSAADLQSLFERYSFTQMEQELIRDKTVTGLFFLIEKNNLRPVIYVESLIRAGHVYRNEVRQFLEFDFRKGRMMGRASDASTAGEADGTKEAGNAKLNYRYSAKFEATLRGELLNSELEGAAAPGELVANLRQGTAEGTLSVNGSIVNLKYAYAARERLFFDEPEESLTVLITDQQHSKEVLLRSLRREAPIEKSFQGVSISFHSHRSPPYGAGMIIFHKSLESGYFATATEPEGVTITRENISARAAGEDRTTRDKWTYSVKFNAPFNK
jgi:hypothetical protein